MEKPVCTDHGRIEQIDVIKAIGMILMVAGHAFIPYASFVYLFHVALFFIASGFTYKLKNSSSVSAVAIYIKGKLRRLWIPYFLWNAVFSIFNNLFIRINVYTDNPDIYNYVTGDHDLIHDFLNIRRVITDIIRSACFAKTTQLGTALWFIRVLFFVSVLFCFTDLLLSRSSFRSRLIIQGIISVILLCAGYICSVYEVNIPIIPQTMSCYWLFYIGHVFALIRDRFEETKSGFRLFCVVLGLVILIVQFRFGSIYLANNQYINPVFFVVASISGWVVVYVLADYIVKKGLNGFKRIMTYMGEHTLPVVALQYLAFKPVAYVVKMHYHIPDYCVAAFPNLYGSRAVWWIAYMAAGICIPLMLDQIVMMILNKLRRERSS